MPIDVLMNEARDLPDEYLNMAISYVRLLKNGSLLTNSDDSDNISDMSEFFGCMNLAVDGLAYQRELRDEWN